GSTSHRDGQFFGAVDADLGTTADADEVGTGFTVGFYTRVGRQGHGVYVVATKEDGAINHVFEVVGQMHVLSVGALQHAQALAGTGEAGDANAADGGGTGTGWRVVESERGGRGVVELGGVGHI